MHRSRSYAARLALITELSQKQATNIVESIPSRPLVLSECGLSTSSQRVPHEAKNAWMDQFKTPSFLSSFRSLGLSLKYVRFSPTLSFPPALSPFRTDFHAYVTLTYSYNHTYFTDQQEIAGIRAIRWSSVYGPRRRFPNYRRGNFGTAQVRLRPPRLA